MILYILHLLFLKPLHDLLQMVVDFLRCLICDHVDVFLRNSHSEGDLLRVFGVLISLLDVAHLCTGFRDLSQVLIVALVKNEGFFVSERSLTTCQFVDFLLELLCDILRKAKSVILLWLETLEVS